jgi:peptide-methionine (S)-S-oxide reductase
LSTDALVVTAGAVLVAGLLLFGVSSSSRGIASAGAKTAPLPKPNLELPAGKTGEVRAIILAGGCFWCTEGAFEQFKGVIDVTSGYAGDPKETANYKAVCTGNTNPAEAIKITYDSGAISYSQLLQIFFLAHDPTTKDRQGNDVGPQYRSAIFYADVEELARARRFLAEVGRSGAFEKPIVTMLEPLRAFYPAESYHQNYVCDNPNQSYVRAVAWPKVKKVRKEFSDKLKEQSPLEQPASER